MAGEEVSPRLELLDELYAMFHGGKVFHRSAGVVSHGFRHGFDTAAAGLTDASDVEHVAVVIFDDEVVAAFSLSPVETHGEVEWD